MTAQLAVYGSLRRGLALPHQPEDFDQILAERDPCLITGRLVDLGSYPGLVEGPGRVVGELCHLTGDASLSLFDAYEGYDGEHPAGSQYLRVMVRLIDPAVDAWTYLYNRTWTPQMLISSGDWDHHLARGPTGDPWR
ncbi:MAG: gamma-glutamylcyclotransferase [Actinomycetota bacterium]|nr:gamma-glutamylcyclotransferase [Actinomycetota bacterium]